MYRSTRTRSISRVLPLRRVRFCSLKSIILSLAVLALLPPIVFHFRLRRFHQIQLRRCGWLRHPPLVCAHGGDPSNASPNTVYSLCTFLSIYQSIYLFSFKFKFNCNRRWRHISRLFTLEWTVLRSTSLALLMEFCLLSMIGTLLVLNCGCGHGYVAIP